MILRRSVRIGRCKLLLLLAMSCYVGVSAVGVNYGTTANDLPSANDVVELVKSTYISQIKLYNADPSILTALTSSGIDVVIGVANDQISSLGASASFAQQWVTTNVIAYYPAVKIIAIAVGNEVLTALPNVSTSLVPALQNLHTALFDFGLSDKIKVSTPHSFGVLVDSYPPSEGVFRTDLSGPFFVPLLQFLSQTGAPFMINAYPYFGYRDNPKLSISYALFEPNAGVQDTTTGLQYDNLFDAQVDAIYAAMSKLGHQDIKVTVSETGWPSFGDSNEVGVSVTNAQTYNANLLKHVSTNPGTPARPGVPVDTFIFSLFNENMKPGPTSERNFGLFLPDRTTVYNAGFMLENNGSSPVITSPPPSAVSPSSPPPLPPSPYSNSPPPPSSSLYAPPPPPFSIPPPSPSTPPPSTNIPPAPSPPSPPFSILGPPPPPDFTKPPPSAPPPPYPVPHNPPSGPTPTPDVPPSSFTPPPPASRPPPHAGSPPSLPLAPPPPSTNSLPPPSFFTPPSGATSPPPPTTVEPPPLAPPGTTPAPPNTPSGPNTWCVSKPGVALDDLVNALNYACGEGGADCNQIQSGQSCYDPNTLFSHASYAFNSYYAKNGRNYWNCFFGNSSLITITNPSHGSCFYP